MEIGGPRNLPQSRTKLKEFAEFVTAGYPQLFSPPRAAKFLQRRRLRPVRG